MPCAHYMYMFDRAGACLHYHEWARPRAPEAGLAEDAKLMFGLLFSLRAFCVKVRAGVRSRVARARAHIGCAHARTHACRRVRTRTRTRTHTDTCAHTHLRGNAHARVLTHTRTHARSRSHSHTHTRARPRANAHALVLYASV